MKIPNAARYNAVIWLFILPSTLCFLLPGLRMIGVQFVRQGWILDHPIGWLVGWWLWLMAIFGWMWLLVTLSWTYLPAHRVVSMMQSALLIIGTILLMLGVIMWMGVLPSIVDRQDVETFILLIDALALNLLGAGCLMGGIATTWIGFDLYRQRVLARPWPLLCMIAGLSVIPSPFLFPLLFPYHLLLATICWFCWSIYLALLPQLPAPFPEY